MLPTEMLLSLLLKFALVASVSSCDYLWGCDSPSPPDYNPPPNISPSPPVAYPPAPPYIADTFVSHDDFFEWGAKNPGSMFFWMLFMSICGPCMMLLFFIGSGMLSESKKFKKNWMATNCKILSKSLFDSMKEALMGETGEEGGGCCGCFGKYTAWVQWAWMASWETVTHIIAIVSWCKLVNLMFSDSYVCAIPAGDAVDFEDLQFMFMDANGMCGAGGCWFQYKNCVPVKETWFNKALNGTNYLPADLVPDDCTTLDGDPAANLRGLMPFPATVDTSLDASSAYTYGAATMEATNPRAKFDFLGMHFFMWCGIVAQIIASMSLFCMQRTVLQPKSLDRFCKILAEDTPRAKWFLRCVEGCLVFAPIWVPNTFTVATFPVMALDWNLCLTTTDMAGTLPGFSVGGIVFSFFGFWMMAVWCGMAGGIIGLCGLCCIGGAGCAVFGAGKAASEAETAEEGAAAAGAGICACFTCGFATCCGGCLGLIAFMLCAPGVLAVCVGFYYAFITLGSVHELLFALTDPTGFAKAEWEEAQVVALNSWAKLSTLGIIILALSHKCARFCCCPGAGRPWADDDDDDEDVEFDVEMTGKELTMAVTVSEKDGDHTSAVSIKGSV